LLSLLGAQVNLPPRTVPTEGERALGVAVAARPSADDLTGIQARVSRSGGALGAEVALRPVQLEALAELRRAGGLLGAIGVGHGKTLIGLLAPTVLEPAPERPVYLLPPGLVGVVLAEAARFGGAFDIRPDLTILPYSLLSHPAWRGVLEELRPDLIIADEAHALRNLRSTRTRRVLRYLAEHDECRFVALSGTLTTRSIKDLAHLAEAALGDGAPLPRHGSDLERWAAVLDADGQPSYHDIEAVLPLVKAFADKTRRPQGPYTSRPRVRGAFRRRLQQTAGVVLTDDSSTGCSLVVRRVLEPQPPEELLELAEQVDADGATPDGERVFATDEEAAACKRRLILGYHYSWDWCGVAERDRERWLQARSSYFAGLRGVLDLDLPGLDSPALVEREALRPILGLEPKQHIPGWFVDRCRVWRNTRNIADPKTVVHWHSTYLVDDAVAWLDSQTEPAILWYRDRAFGEALAAAGVDVRGEGDQPPATPGPVALSIAAQGQGHNLQAWRVQRVVGCPSGGARWEQLLGRTHRAGQLADVVVCDVYQHHELERRALARALRDARYVEESTGQRQKLRLARVVDAAGGVDTV